MGDNVPTPMNTITIVFWKVYFGTQDVSEKFAAPNLLPLNFSKHMYLWKDRQSGQEADVLGSQRHTRNNIRHQVGLGPSRIWRWSLGSRFQTSRDNTAVSYSRNGKSTTFRHIQQDRTQLHRCESPQTRRALWSSRLLNSHTMHVAVECSSPPASFLAKLAGRTEVSMPIYAYTRKYNNTVTNL